MRKVVLLLVAALIAAPAMAAVNFSVAGSDDGTLTIGYTTTDGDLPRGIALTVSCTNGATVLDETNVVSVDAAYNTYIDWAYSNLSGYDIGMGHPLAEMAGAGALAAAASDFSVCMGVLDQDENQAAGPASAEPLIVLALTEGSGASEVTVDVDTLRGGVVGSQLDVTGLPTTVTVSFEPSGCACNGDSNASNNISVGDLSTIVSFLSPAYKDTIPPYTCDPTPAGYECYDANQDNKISVGDLSYIVSFLSPAYKDTVPPYTTPDGVCVPVP